MGKDIHSWFGLTYASYLVVPRSVLQSMPDEWQHKFVDLLDELGETDWYKKLPDDSEYKVELRKLKYTKDNRTTWGEKIRDPLGDYRRGARNVFAE